MNHVVVVFDQASCVLEVAHHPWEVYPVGLKLDAVELLQLVVGDGRQTWALTMVHPIPQIQVELLHLAILVAKDHHQKEHVLERLSQRWLL